jgi:hypothetical protein
MSNNRAHYAIDQSLNQELLCRLTSSATLGVIDALRRLLLQWGCKAVSPHPLGSTAGLHWGLSGPRARWSAAIELAAELVARAAVQACAAIHELNWRQEGRKEG